ncbi:MAG: zinc-ribbon domain-containing protein [Thermodesulfobacteriota bacterium]
MFCKNCGTKLEEGAKFCQNCGSQTNTHEGSAPVEYYAISPKRLILFSVLTLGIYELYWFYKNWQAVKESERQKMYPFWRAVFAVFFCYSLFKKVLESAKKQAYQSSYSPGWLAAVYISLLLLGSGLGNIDSYDLEFNFIWLIVVISTFIPLLPIQKAINFNNEKIKGSKVLPEGFSSGEVVLIVIGVLWFLLVLWGTFLP